MLRSDVKIGRCYVFFFSSRRRHTRFDCDWSSDVCSSDLLSVLLDLASSIVGCIKGDRVHPVSTTDRKSTRLNSSHSQISYAVFCLKKKKVETKKIHTTRHDVHESRLQSYTYVHIRIHNND